MIFLKRFFKNNKNKTLQKLKTLKKLKDKSSIVSSNFSSMWGEQNNIFTRKLRLKEKNVVADMIVQSIANQYNFYKGKYKNHERELENFGYTKINKHINKEKSQEIFNEFKSIPFSCHHVYDKSKPTFSLSKPGENVTGAINPSRIIESKELINCFLKDNILDIIEGYFGAPGRIFHLNLMCTLPSKENFGTQNFHRDNSHPKFCVVFLYLNDVTEKNGSHQYISNTHSTDQFNILYPELDSNKYFDLSEDSYGRNELYEKTLHKGIKTINGEAGTCFITDPRGLHRGLKVEKDLRLLAWARFAPIIDDSLIPKISVKDDLLKNFNERQLYTISSIIK